MAKILTSGFSKIAFHQGNETALIVSKFVFANIPGLLPTDNINLAQGMPAQQHIVYEKTVEAFGYVAVDKVVYSTILSPDEGDFYFNWVGLVTDDNTLFAVSYVPVQHKYKTVGLNIGNTLTRNFLVQYQNAIAITGITIPAAAWQLDFLGRLNSAEENLRLDMTDFFGSGFFIGNGFNVFVDGATVKAKAGVGYVGGLRVSINADQVITTGALPKDIYVESYINKTPTSATVVALIQVSPENTLLSDFVDGAGNKHYLSKIAKVSAGNIVTDYRKTIAANTSIVDSLLQLLALKAPLASPALSGNPTAPTQAATDNSTRIANTAFVKAAFANLIASAPGTLDTLNELAAALGDDPNFATTVANSLGLKAPLASPALSGVPTAPTAAAGTNTTQLANTAFVQAVKAVLDAAIALKAPLASPALTGIPTAPTAAAGTNNSQLANTAFVHAIKVALDAAVLLKAPLDSPALSGTPTVPTPGATDNSTRIANTAFVKTALANLIASAPGTLDTLNELAAALGDDPNFATTMANALGLKAPLASPALSGIPTAPTPAISTNTAQLATTAFVQNVVRGYLNKSGLTGGVVILTDDEATNAVLAFTGTLTSDLVIQLTAGLDRVWTVINGTTGSFSLSLRRGTSGSTVTVAQGKRNIVFMNNSGMFDALNDFESISLTGTPTAPTAAPGTNNTQLANTAFVQAVKALLDAAIVLKAPLASPALSGNPTVPTQVATDNSTRIANTAFVKTALANLIASAPSTLDTLNELAAALGDDPNFATTMANALAGKQNVLGYKPVENGTGINQGPNTVKIGWATDASGLMATVDNTDLGRIVLQSWVNSVLTSYAPLVSPALSGSPTVPTPGSTDNSTRIANTAFVKTALANLVASAPGTLDTLNELAAALGDDPNFATTMANALAAKQNALGFSPVQQGTGIDQLTNAIKIGWSTPGKVKVTVDATNIGEIAMEGWVSEYFSSKEATQAQVDDGSSNNFITPIKLGFGFEVLFGANGYVKLPKLFKGITFQWGLVTSNVSANTTINWNYPREFTEVFFTIPVHSNGGVISEKAMINAHTMSNTQTRYNLSANGIQGVRWFAFGRI